MATAMVVHRDEPYGKSKFEVIQAYHDFLKCNNIDQKVHEKVIQEDLYDIAHLCPFVTYRIEQMSTMQAKKSGARFVSKITVKGVKTDGKSV